MHIKEYINEVSSVIFEEWVRVYSAKTALLIIISSSKWLKNTTRGVILANPPLFYEFLFLRNALYLLY